MKPKVNEDQIEDVVEFALNRPKPEIKTKRTVGGLTVKINRTTFKIKVTKQGRK